MIYGGPWHGEWITAPAGRPMMIMPPVEPVQWFADPEPLTEPIAMPIQLIYKRAKISGWRVILPFWTSLIELSDIEPGAVMPGYVVGEPAEHEPCCRVCFGRAMYANLYGLASNREPSNPLETCSRSECIIIYGFRREMELSL
jgi:hypothetical protein